MTRRPVDPDPDWEKQNPVLAALLEKALIPGHVLRQYRRVTPDVRWSDTSEALRAEMKRGNLVRERWEGGSYISVHVRGRFRVDFEHEAGSDDLRAVDLRPLRTRRAGRGGSRKAA